MIAIWGQIECWKTDNSVAPLEGDQRDRPIPQKILEAVEKKLEIDILS